MSSHTAARTTSLPQVPSTETLIDEAPCPPRIAPECATCIHIHVCGAMGVWGYGVGFEACMLSVLWTVRP